MKTSPMKFLTLVFLIIVAVSCASSGYPAAAKQYDADSLVYAAAGTNIQAQRLAGHVTDAQWNQFSLDQAAARVADAQVYADLVAWKSTGTKPVNYDTDYMSLATAQQKVIALSNGVSK